MTLPKKKPPYLVIYDLDGTLIDSATSITNALNLATERLIGASVEEHHVRQWIGNGSLKLVERAARHCGVNITTNRTEAPVAALPVSCPPANQHLVTKLHELFIAEYSQQTSHESRLYPGTQKMLVFFTQQGIPQVIATNKPQQLVPPILRDLGIQHFFGAIVGGNSLPYKKPNPEPLLTLCRRYECLPEQALMIGDSKADFDAAQAASIPCWLVLQGYAQGEDLEQLGAARVFDDTQKLLTHLQGTKL